MNLRSERPDLPQRIQGNRTKLALAVAAESGGGGARAFAPHAGRTLAYLVEHHQPSTSSSSSRVRFSNSHQPPPSRPHRFCTNQVKSLSALRATFFSNYAAARAPKCKYSTQNLCTKVCDARKLQLT